MSERVNVVASFNYIQFVVFLEENRFYCLIPRKDAQVFCENVKPIAHQEICSDEISFEAGCMYVECAWVGLSSIFQCTNMNNEKMTQFALSMEALRDLINKMEKVEKSLSKLYSEPVSSGEPWGFVSYSEKESVL